MIRRTLTLAALAAALAGAAPAAAHPPAHHPWNWATMGDHKRGVVLDDGYRMKLGPCQYRALRLSGAIDLNRTSRMGGDYTAMRVVRCTGGPFRGGRLT